MAEPPTSVPGSGKPVANPQRPRRSYSEPEMSLQGTQVSAPRLDLRRLKFVGWTGQARPVTKPDSLPPTPRSAAREEDGAAASAVAVGGNHSTLHQKHLRVKGQPASGASGEWRRPLNLSRVSSLAARRRFGRSNPDDTPPSPTIGVASRAGTVTTLDLVAPTDEDAEVVGPGHIFSALREYGSQRSTNVVETVPDVTKWFVSEWQANIFTGWLFFPHHNDATYHNFLRSSALNELISQHGGRLYAVTSEPTPHAQTGWREESNIGLVVDDKGALAQYVSRIGLVTVAGHAAASGRFILYGPALVVLARSGRVLFTWTPNAADAAFAWDRALAPDAVWRRVRRTMEEEEGIILPPAPSLQAATADMLRNTQQGWPWRAWRSLQFWRRSDSPPLEEIQTPAVQTVIAPEAETP